MKKMFIALSASSVLLSALPAQAISVQEIITLARIGVSGDEMIKAIDRDRTVFNLTVNEILELKKAGLPEEVLKYMLKTPQTYGGATAVKPQNEPPPIQEMTPEEKAALEAKQREEAQRLAAEAAKAEESQRRAFADGILKKGMDLAHRENCVGAIQTFLDFITQGGYQRGSDEYYTAWYGIAHALNQCELYQSSANYLVDVLLEGPEKPFFQQAFWELRALRKQINYSPPDLEKLTEFSVANFSRRFQDEFNYFLGEFFYDYNNFTKALDFFAAVSSDAPEYPRALYLTGLVQTQNNLYKSAVENFQRAINATETLDDVDPEVRTLSYLALARIAYEAENFDAAVYYYRKVPTDSPKLATAFYESAWTFFLKGDYERALGTFQALHSPYFQHFFYPELWILEATIYVNLCYVERAEQSIKQFDERVSALSIPLKKMVQELRTPQDYWNALVGIVEGAPTFQLDKRLVRPVLANVEFYNLYRTVRQIEKEEAYVTGEQAGLGQFGTDLLAKLGALRQSRLNEAGIKVQQLMKQVEAELAEYAVKKTELEIDITTQRTDLEMQKLQGGTAPEEAVGEAGGSQAIAGGDSMAWKYEGEYWGDEIRGFRSKLTSRCAKQ
ncbi:MAG: tetratricopeptide repeat protein [Myxococcales bacterium]|nr:tetratricopeptide repeat protein [Myxococcales bacterium]